MLGSASAALQQVYDVAVLDLDGVVYIGGAAVPRAAEALAAAEDAGMHLAFVTNNASRPPEVVGEHLRELGIAAHNDDVVTSAQAAARLLSRDLEPGSNVFVIGGEGMHRALEERGLRGLTTLDEGAIAVAQGYGPEMPWKQVINGAILVARGLPWVASNTDMTVPTAAGEGPGNGSLVALVGDFARRTPVVAGKPESALFEETLLRVGGERPLVIGDRLDTDIEGAVRLGWDSLLVMTGVTGLDELLSCPPERRPTYVGEDLRSLAMPPAVPQRADSGWHCDGWTAAVADGTMSVTGQGEAQSWWAVVAAAGWEHLDTYGRPVERNTLRPPG